VQNVVAVCTPPAWTHIYRLPSNVFRGRNQYLKPAVPTWYTACLKKKPDAFLIIWRLKRAFSVLSVVVAPYPRPLTGNTGHFFFFSRFPHFHVWGANTALLGRSGTINPCHRACSPCRGVLRCLSRGCLLLWQGGKMPPTPLVSASNTTFLGHDAIFSVCFQRRPCAWCT